MVRSAKRRMLGGDVEAVALKFIRAQNRSKAVELGGILSDPMVDSLSASDWHGVIPTSLEWVDGPVTLSTVKNAFACVTYEDAFMFQLPLRSSKINALQL